MAIYTDDDDVTNTLTFNECTCTFMVGIKWFMITFVAKKRNGRPESQEYAVLKQLALRTNCCTSIQQMHIY